MSEGQFDLFPKELLQELAFCSVKERFEMKNPETDKYEESKYFKVRDKIIDTSRWNIHHEMVFTDGESYWRSSYQTGATEYQDERPYEYDRDQIKCERVVPKEKVVITYVRKQD